MKKEEMELKEVIKAAILEAFAEMYGITTTTEEAGDEAPKDDEGKEDESGKENGEGDKKKDPIRPKPNSGIVGFSMKRK